ncbi:efflux RND transporter periplasmic adaptor subunit [Reichenbachiella agarivorans]|uniref:Efflux RND transporter periplasmic adaptor subunit n=1 Tax=Reichenbachiella agarivorans TaxID=2979464 RepID=A0ABY6CRT3_9BACT|nr:efflux RND transporter periplasmic adaptor subunit [Reichenbachiella agarivorans]UXP32740.1 efflux RND transporter periplasmic adaptor subunit [Reichenbachiella agarivorans]
MNIRKILYPNTILIAFVAVVAAACTGGNSSPRQAGAPATVTTIGVALKEVEGVDTYPARVVPVNQVELRPQLSGYITKIFVKDGAEVKKGQNLYEIDRTKYVASFQQAKANVSTAEANLARVEQDLKRYEALQAKDAIAGQKVDYAKADYETAKAQVAAAKAQLSSTSNDLQYSIIKAPFSGTIGIHNVRIGTQVSPGQPLLNTLSSDDPVAVDFVINEKEIPRFNRLKKEEQPDSLFSLLFSDGTKYPYSGKVIAIDRAVGVQTGTLTIRLSFPNPERDLIPGMTMNLEVLNQDHGKQITIPYKAVVEQMGEYFVYTVQDGTAHQVRIQLGTIVGEGIVVRSGLKGGETLVVDGLQKLREGVPVQTAATSK